MSVNDGCIFYGEFLFIIFQIDEKIWNSHKHWYLFFIGIAKDVLNNYKKEELDEKVFDVLITINY
jgi:hypothetical protein